MKDANNNDMLPALNFTPPTISLDFEALTTRICAITEQYKGLLVQEQDIQAVKSELAGLNKLKDMLAAARKEAVAKISAPIKEFEDKVKSLENQIFDTRAMLDEQVKAFIQRDRDARRTKVQMQIDMLKEEMQAPDAGIAIKDKWLTASCTDRVISDEVRAAINAFLLEKAKAELAKKEYQIRAAMIESRVKMKNAETGLDFRVSRFFTGTNTSAETPEDAVIANIDAVFQKELEAKAERDALIARAEAANIDAKKVQPLADAVASTPELFAHGATAMQRTKKALVIKAEYYSTESTEISKLYEAMKGLCITCSVNVVSINVVPF